MIIGKRILCGPQFFQRSLMLRTPLAFYGKKTQQPHPVCQYFNPVEYKHLTMDDMPVPICSWNEYHAKRNRSYNAVFAFGLVSLIGSIICVKETIFFNALPPPYPFDEDTD
ncbi:uncharacterized protein LOC112680356 [Sipha flava]|uniref:Uncharacterized protein LOC112680356 n=1 Tax=Sipha flava TaxID=143950 RepID=A0A2S2QSW3_9HEMI|nr:uncharacterized protein LOC112680356 [Sipha flava]